jgi:hypothetical protein
MHMGMHDLLARDHPDVGAKVEAADACVEFPDLGLACKRQCVNSLAFMEPRIEDVGDMPLRDDQSVQRLYWMSVAKCERVLVLLDDDKRFALTEDARRRHGSPPIGPMMPAAPMALTQTFGPSPSRGI